MTASGAVVGALLAVGAGSRMGGPKARVGPLAGDESPVSRVAGWMHAGGRDEVIVVIGARATEVRASLPRHPWFSVVEATDWSRGMGASLRAGRAHTTSGRADAALVTLVDLPDVHADVFQRLLATAGASDRVSIRSLPGRSTRAGRDTPF